MRKMETEGLLNFHMKSYHHVQSPSDSTTGRKVDTGLQYFKGTTRFSIRKSAFERRKGMQHRF